MIDARHETVYTGLYVWDHGRMRNLLETGAYSLKDLARTHEISQFGIIGAGSKLIELNVKSREKADQKHAKTNEIKQVLGLSTGAAEQPPVPTGKVISDPSLATQNAPAREDTVKLVTLPLAYIPSVGNNLSRRYRMSFEENGQTTEAFFTPALDSGTRAGIDQLFLDAIHQHPEYEHELSAIRDYYTTNDIGDVYLPSFEKLPFDELGIRQERATELKQDHTFCDIYRNISSLSSNIVQRNAMLEGQGMVLGEGKRIDLRNVAMSDVGDALGISDQVLSRSRPAQVMVGDQLIDGVVMNKADGVDIGSVKLNHPMAHIAKEQVDDVYNTE